MGDLLQAVLLGEFASANLQRLQKAIKSRWSLTAFPDESPTPVLNAALADAHAVITLRWDAERLAPKMRLLHVCGAGTDRIDFSNVARAASVCNAFGHEEAMGEFAVMTMLIWQQQLLQSERSFRSGSWEMSSERGAHPHKEFAGSRVVVIGMGGIGRAVAHKAKLLGAIVTGVNRSPITSPDVDQTFGFDRLDETITDAHFVVLCCALNDETRGLIDRRRLKLMGGNAILMNIARGPLAVEEDLYEALRDGVIAGGIIDTWYQYPNSQNSSPRPSSQPFHKLPNVIMTPHTSGWTVGMLDRRWKQIAENLDRLSSGSPLQNVVKPAQD